MPPSDSSDEEESEEGDGERVEEVNNQEELVNIVIENSLRQPQVDDAPLWQVRVQVSCFLCKWKVTYCMPDGSRGLFANGGQRDVEGTSAMGSGRRRVLTQNRLDSHRILVTGKRRTDMS
jgi:hypothetical protein